jgi:peptidoglycan/LPS O-acetylase OafA/YrhL
MIKPSLSISKSAWIVLFLSAISFVIGIWLTRHFLCSSYGPNAFAISHVFCFIAIILFAVNAFKQRSLKQAKLLFVLILIGAFSIFAAIGLTIPGCSGI